MKFKKHFYLFGLCLLAVAMVRTFYHPVQTSPQLEDIAVAGPVVVELFTSSNCPYCPPADEFLKQLSKRAHIIALGCHITYWDRPQGRADPYALGLCTDRQDKYDQADGNKGVYTPQMIINGQARMVGSKSYWINQSIEKARDGLPEISIEPLATEKGEGFELAFPASLINHPFHDKPYRLIAMIYGQDTQGNYINPVLDIRDLSSFWDGVSETANVPFDNLPPQLSGIAVLLQSGDHANEVILGAGQIDLHED
ncbi:MAG TPA: DUF1223 domain-containing protein [Alphaproteobacteria bacterium]|nr:DUF1223 domain-containing protein [Alphaproteobacteria bacterium]